MLGVLRKAASVVGMPRNDDNGKARMNYTGWMLGRRWLLLVVCWTAGLLGCGKTTSDTDNGGEPGTSTPAGNPIIAGDAHTCALTSSGVWCWGDNEYGQLGINSNNDSYVPVPVQGLPRSVQAVAAGTYHTCALSNGRVWCWGDNASGALGNGSTKNSLVPVPVQGLPKDVTAIAAGGFHTCAVAGGGVWCWGANYCGQLGDNSTVDRLNPVSVQGLSAGAQAITAGEAHTCALVDDGVQCWGWYGLDQPGQGPDPRAMHLLPTAIEGLSAGVQAVVAGSSHTCVVVNGGAQCWGWNDVGQLGDGLSTGSFVPVPVQGLAAGVEALSAGWDFTCALVNGGVQCWGYAREIGGNETSSGGIVPVPTPVVGLASGVTAISSGDEHTCVVVNGGIECWGWNDDGELGDNSTTRTFAPVPVQGITL